MKIRLCLLIMLVAWPVIHSSANPIDGLLERIDKGASRKFVIELQKSEKDFFELDRKGSKVVVRGNNYVNIATGIHWYLKYYAGIHLSWNGMQAKLPEPLPAVRQKERHETSLSLRYDFNYCTYSYTMAFWDWERWEKEIDWMALHGINLPLAAVGQECIWFNMLQKLGYSKEEINRFIAGPAFLAWWAMNNLEGWGGPNPDSWYVQQAALQKKILKRMREYGIKPVFPGYSGMVPHDADRKLGLNVAKSDLWNGFIRPAFLQPTDARFAEIATLYYEEQEKLFGKADYYSMDPFHEVKDAASVDFDAAGEAILKAMKKVNPQAVWVVQGWTENPRPEMIKNRKNGDLLVLDLFSECRPMWGIPSIWKREKGYEQHDWLFCMLLNFGGNVGLHGRMDQLIDHFYQTKNHPLAAHLKGIGLTMEGTENNPVMFELMCELPWRQDKFTKETWLKDYLFARYNTRDEKIEQAWMLLANSIYNCPSGNNQQGPHESIFCGRPSLNNFQVSSWSKMQNYYDPTVTEKAARLMLEVADKYRGNNNFEFDLVDIVRQAIADKGRIVYNRAIADFKSFDKRNFIKNSQKFLEMLLLQDKLLGTRSEFRVGRWIEQARKKGTTPAEKELYEWNARVQITTWGNRICADDGGLRDYAHKEWNGILRDFYYKRWAAYWQTLQDQLDGKPEVKLDYYAMEEPWTLANNPYSAASEGDCIEVAKEVFGIIFRDGSRSHVTEMREESLVSYIDPRVGTAPSGTRTAGKFGKNTEEYGQTLPAVLEPNGMNFWTPQTRDTEYKCIAPYYYADTLLQGFRNSHWIVGGCTQDYGSMTLMPLAGRLKCLPETRATRFSHQEEKATPAYYSVYLPDENIQAEMTARSRSAIFRFTYRKAGKGYLVVNPNSDEGKGYIAIDTLNNLIYGYNPVHRIYQGWGEAAGYSGHFVVRFNKRVTDFGVFKGDTLLPQVAGVSNCPRIGAYLEFDMTAGEEILVKAASSFVDREGAERNLEEEIPHWDFDRTSQELLHIWEQRLALIQVETDDRTAKEKFYSAFYRASFLPRTFNDVDGRYPSFSATRPPLQLSPGKTYYEDFSMWDTYRALHPLINLLTPQKGGEMMQSLVYKYEQGGWLPTFPCWNSYTAAMIGDHCISAIGDAYSKGIRNFDIAKAYKGMRKNAFESPATQEEYRNGKGRRALHSYLKYGYIPLEDNVPDAFHTQEQVSRTLEYAYNDFVLAQTAKALDKMSDYKQLIQRARNYRNVIDPRTGYAQGRHADGTFLKEENAFGFTRFITEGAPCHYTWYVPHDVYGLMECMGGRKNYVAKLDSMFSEQYYWHGNEPCHQIAFMFNYAGEPWKTQRTVRHILETEYLNTPGGLSGNDDAGQMSAWYMFAAMGFYPVCPGTPYYMIASPSFPVLTLQPEKGKPFTIKACNASKENIYIQSAKLNGKPYTRNYLTHQDIISGGVLELVMGNTPNKEWGSKAKDCPPDVMNNQDK